MKKWFVLLILVATGWWLLRDEPAKWKGIPAAAEPIQTSKDLPAPFRHGEYLITPLATYSIKAIALSRDHYRFDPAAKLAPLDLALGWKSMSISSVINDLKITQSARWYEYSWRGEAPLEPTQIAQQSANTHCIPADKNIERQLMSIRRHDLVMLEGYLVEVTGPNGWHWRSSLTRDDTGGGACEVLFITSLTRRKL